MNLENLNVRELTKEEMVSIEGGSFIGKVWKWIKGIFTGNDNGTPREGEAYTTVVSLEF